MTVDPIDPPDNIQFGYVVFQGAGVSADREDVDIHPNFDALTGTITFTPKVLRLADATATPNPLSLAAEVVTGTIGPDGYLGIQIDANTWQAGVELTATDNTSLNPVDWVYTVDYSGLKFAVSGKRVGWPSHDIYVPGGETIDLTTVMPVSDATPIGVPAAEAAAAIAQQAALDAAAAAEAAEFVLLVEDPPDSGFYQLQTTSGSLIFVENPPDSGFFELQVV